MLSENIAVVLTATDVGIFAKLPPPPPQYVPSVEDADANNTKPSSKKSSRGGSKGKRRGPEYSIDMSLVPFQAIEIWNKDFIGRSSGTAINIKCHRHQATFFLVVAYTDGFVYVYSSPWLHKLSKALKHSAVTINEENIDVMPNPQCVCCFKGHNGMGPDAVFKTLGLQISSTNYLLRNVYSIEIFTMDVYGTLCHWAVPCDASIQNGSPETVEIILFGVSQMISCKVLLRISFDCICSPFLLVLIKKLK